MEIQIKRETGFREIEIDDNMNMGEHSLGPLVIRWYFSTSLGWHPVTGWDKCMPLWHGLPPLPQEGREELVCSAGQKLQRGGKEYGASSVFFLQFSIRSAPHFLGRSDEAERGQGCDSRDLLLESRSKGKEVPSEMRRDLFFQCFLSLRQLAFTPLVHRWEPTCQ